MAKVDGASTVRSDQNTPSVAARIPRVRHRRAAPPLSMGLLETIETERSRLMKAQALLNCTLAAMECEGDTHATYYPDVLQLAQELVHQSIDQLDSLRLRPMIEALERTEPSPSTEIPELDTRANKELRDSANVIYIA